MPLESDEVRALKVYGNTCGTFMRVTATNGGTPGVTHALHSWHYAPGTNGEGLAVDFAGPVPSHDDESLRRIYEALTPLIPHTHELYYSGPGGGFWVEGVQRPVAASVAAEHHDHVHIAVRVGFTWTPQTKELTMNNDLIAVIPTPTGKGYTIFAADGAVYAFGDAEYHGGLIRNAQGAWVLR